MVGFGSLSTSNFLWFPCGWPLPPQNQCVYLFAVCIPSSQIIVSDGCQGLFLMKQLGSCAVLIEPGYGFLLGWEGSVFNFLRTDSQQCPHHFLSAVYRQTQIITYCLYWNFSSNSLDFCQRFANITNESLTSLFFKERCE